MSNKPVPAEDVAFTADLRTNALIIVALVVVLGAIYLAAAFFIPLVISVFLSSAFAPLVARLHAWGMPRNIGAAIVMVAFVALSGAALYRAGSDTIDLLEVLPQAVEKARIAFTAWQKSGVSPLRHVQETAAELEKLAVAAQPQQPVAPAARPAPPAPALDIRPLLLVGTGGTIVAAGQAVSILLLTYFLLAAGELFRHKLIGLVGTSLGRRKIALRILDDVHRLNQHYFGVILFVNLAIGIAVGIAMYTIGVERPLAWGILAVILHFIPYLGATALAAAAGVAAYAQLGGFSALLTIGVVLAISVLFGVGVQTWLMGQAARMNAPMVFVSLLFWGVLWGPWGLLMAVPIMVTLKTVCDHIEQLRGWGSLLGPLPEPAVYDNDKSGDTLDRASRST